MKNYKKTKLACYLGFITQAIAANFAPLLYLKFHAEYNITLGNIALISTCFFFTQLIVDLFCAKFVDKIGYRICIVTSEACSAIGLVGLAFLPGILPNPFAGIIISVIIYAIGSGLIEVLCSPIIEACPFDNKEATMSLLHSFYCWGAVGTILVSTIFFAVFGIDSWKWLAVLRRHEVRPGEHAPYAVCPAKIDQNKRTCCKDAGNRSHDSRQRNLLVILDMKDAARRQRSGRRRKGRRTAGTGRCKVPRGTVAHARDSKAVPAGQSSNRSR